MRQKDNNPKLGSISLEHLRKLIQDSVSTRIINSEKEPFLTQDEAQNLATIYQTVTGVHPRRILRFTKPSFKQSNSSKIDYDHIELMNEPTKIITLDALYNLHQRSWPQGLAPSMKQISYMLERDAIFAAFDKSTADHRLVSVIHLRLMPRGSRITAHDVMFERRKAPVEILKIPKTTEPIVLCYAAVTHEEYRGRNIAQRLIMEKVLPYLQQSPYTARLLWATSSPATYAVDTGRQLSSIPEWSRLVQFCDEHLRMHRPLGVNSLCELIRAAEDYLHSNWFLPMEQIPDATQPAEFLAALYNSLPSHTDLVKFEHGSQIDRRHAEKMKQRVRKLLNPSPKLMTSSKENIQASHQASLCLFFLAFGLAQTDVFYPSTGQPVDPIANFHLSNGAVTNSDVGPIPYSRPDDVAAVGFGQQFVYGSDWPKRRDRYKELIQERRERCAQQDLNSIQINWPQTENHIARITARLSLSVY